MSCRNREHDMSLAMDSRLPTGKRASLLRHIGECPSCSETWRAMLEARELTRALPVYDVGTDFRDDLERRIDSGEGAPDAVYRDPIPGATKIRYLASGAAAAAVLLFAWHIGSGGATPTPSPRTSNIAEGPPMLPGPSEPQAPDALQNPDVVQEPVVQGPDAQEPEDRHRLRDRQPVDTAAEMPVGNFMQLQQAPSVPVPVTESALASIAASATALHARELRARMQTVRKKKRPLKETWGDLQGVVKELRTAVGAMQLFDQQGVVWLPRALREDVHNAQRSIELAIRPKASWQDREQHLWIVARTGLERVQRNILVRCCKPVQLHIEVQALNSLPGVKSIFQFRNMRVQPTDGMEPGMEQLKQLMVVLPWQRTIAVRQTPAKPRKRAPAKLRDR